MVAMWKFLTSCPPRQVLAHGKHVNLGRIGSTGAVMEAFGMMISALHDAGSPLLRSNRPFIETTR